MVPFCGDAPPLSIPSYDIGAGMDTKKTDGIHRSLNMIMILECSVIPQLRCDVVAMLTVVTIQPLCRFNFNSLNDKTFGLGVLRHKIRGLGGGRQHKARLHHSIAIGTNHSLQSPFSLSFIDECNGMRCNALPRSSKPQLLLGGGLNIDAIPFDIHRV